MPRFFWIVVVTFLCWLPYLIVAYPGTCLYDTGNQLYQYFGYAPLTNDAPYLQTWLVGIFVRLGMTLFSASFGFFLYITFQMTEAAFVLAYMIKVIERYGVSRKIQIQVWSFYALFPIIPLYIISIGKDINFSIAVLLLSIFILEIVDDPTKFFSCIYKVGVLLILLLLLCLLRNAGFALVLGILPVLWIVTKGYRKAICLISSIVIAFMLLWLNIFLPYKGVQSESLSANLSIPLLQTARYVQQYESEITEKEREVINSVLNYEDLAEEYNPEMSDSVKVLFNNNASSEQIREYMGLYLKQFFRHPICYVDALLNKSYGYFCPDNKGREKRYIFIGLDNIGELNEKGNFNFRSRFPRTISLIKFVMDFCFREIPFLGTLSSIGFYTWCFIVLLFMATRRGNRMRLLVFIPTGFVLLGCIASPVNAYFRYGLPIVFCVPFLWMVTIVNWIQNEREGLE